MSLWAGTHVLTDRGEVTVEELQIGELVAVVPAKLDAASSALAVPEATDCCRIRSIMSLIVGDRNTSTLDYCVRIRKGSWGNGMPHRDLLVSPDQNLSLKGHLIPADWLVNGISILAETGGDVAQVFQVRLDDHRCVLAEGLPAESWPVLNQRSPFIHSSELPSQVLEDGLPWDRNPLTSAQLTEIRKSLLQNAEPVDPDQRRLAQNKIFYDHLFQPGGDLSEVALSDIWRRVSADRD